MKKIVLLLTAFAVLSNYQTSFAASSKSNDKTDTTYTAGVQNNTESAMAYSNRASLKFLKRDMKGAIADFNSAIQMDPANPQLYLNRGYLKHVINDFDGAMDDYNKALSLNPNFAYAYNNRGVLKVSLNDIQGAMDDYEKALNLNKRYSDVYYNRGNLKYMLNDNQGALDDYNKAIEINPKDSEAYNNRGVVKKRMNFNVGALSDYSQAIALNPKDSIAYANRGRLKKLYFDNEGAAIDLDQAVALAENQVFIKNVKPLLSNEHYIAAVPVVNGVTDNPIMIKTQPKAEDRVAYNPANSANIPYKPKTSVLQEQSVKSASASNPATNEKISADASVKSLQVTGNTSKTPTLNAGVGKVTAPEQPAATPMVAPTTNLRLAESYYIRGLQKCVLKDLKGAIADLDKAIANNSKYADAYFYRGAIRKELGDLDGFKKDYSTAIQINPALQAFNDSNALALIH